MKNENVGSIGRAPLLSRLWYLATHPGLWRLARPDTEGEQE